jgi:hypothetical protein
MDKMKKYDYAFLRMDPKIYSALKFASEVRGIKLITLINTAVSEFLDRTSSPEEKRAIDLMVVQRSKQKSKV